MLDCLLVVIIENWPDLRVLTVLQVVVGVQKVMLGKDGRYCTWCVREYC